MKSPVRNLAASIYLAVQLLTAWLMVVAWKAPSANAVELTPEMAVQMTEAGNPEIASAHARHEAEAALIAPASWLERPKLGLMHEQNLSGMQLGSGPMVSWTLSQEVKFPLKYFATRIAQKSRAAALSAEAQDKLLEVRGRVLTSLYRWYSAQRIESLLEAQRETLREIARAAESRRATGAVPMQDESKAHVEQTRLEIEILLQKQETAESEAQSRALLNCSPNDPIALGNNSFKVPKTSTPVWVPSLAQSPILKAQTAMLEEATAHRTHSWLNWAPDFMLNYRRAFQNSPSDAYSWGIEASIPLWFFAKELPETRAAKARVIEAESTVEKTRRDLEAEAKSLGIKTDTYARLIKIYETSLIPQSVAMLNSSRIAYGAGKTSLIELLDSERSLYAHRIAYYQTLSKFVESLTRLERTLGASLSDLPFPNLRQGEKP